MRADALAQKTDADLLRALHTLVARERATTARLLAHIAEVEERRLYAAAGYASMHAYCVGELGFSESCAFKRLQAARATRQFPALLAAIAEGALNLAGVLLLGPHLTTDNADEWIAATAHRRKSEIERMLARKVVRAEPVSVLLPMPIQRDPDPVASPVAGSPPTGEVPAPDAGNEVAASAVHFLLQVKLPRSTHDKLRRAQALLGHAIPSGDVPRVLDRALDALIAQLERRKAGAEGGGSRRQSARVPAVPGRRVPARVRRAVWERDGGRCTFESAAGRRCGAQRLLEFDHVVPVARGGQPTVDGVRLRCRAHNQYEAERMFGAAFMRRKRGVARRGAGSRRADAPTNGQVPLGELIGGLRALGVRVDDARRAAEHAIATAGPSLEEQLRVALQFLGRRMGPSPTRVHPAGAPA